MVRILEGMRSVDLETIKKSLVAMSYDVLEIEEMSHYIQNTGTATRTGAGELPTGFTFEVSKRRTDSLEFFNLRTKLMLAAVVTAKSITPNFSYRPDSSPKTQAEARRRALLGKKAARY